MVNVLHVGLGSTRGMEVIDKIVAKDEQPKNVALLENLCDTMVNGSLCAMGGMTPFPVMSALKYFPNDFGLNLSHQRHKI